jgi:hypothetical protein
MGDVITQKPFRKGTLLRSPGGRLLAEERLSGLHEPLARSCRSLTDVRVKQSARGGQ